MRNPSWNEKRIQNWNSLQPWIEMIKKKGKFQFTTLKFRDFQHFGTWSFFCPSLVPKVIILRHFHTSIKFSIKISVNWWRGARQWLGVTCQSGPTKFLFFFLMSIFDPSLLPLHLPDPSLSSPPPSSPHFPSFSLDQPVPNPNPQNFVPRKFYSYFWAFLGLSCRGMTWFRATRVWNRRRGMGIWKWC